MDNFIYFKKGDIIKHVAVPQHGTITLKVNDGIVTWVEVTKKEKITY
ncbi:DUF2292 domain-containing protein [Streptococcus pneumoniae]